MLVVATTRLDKRLVALASLASSAIRQLRAAVVNMQACPLVLFHLLMLLMLEVEAQWHPLITSKLYDDLCYKSEPADAFLFDYELANDGCRLTCLVLRGPRFDKTIFVDEMFPIVHTEPLNNLLCHNGQGVSRMTPQSLNQLCPPLAL